jgi:hypothetical protein
MRIQHKSSAYLNNNKLRLENAVYFAFAVATNTAMHSLLTQLPISELGQTISTIKAKLPGLVLLSQPKAKFMPFAIPMALGWKIWR